MATFVLVHGAWAGGWIWGRVRNALRDAGHQAFTPTLTGLGERVHLGTADTSLQTHIQDVVHAIEYEDLGRVVLVGHSYSGMVVTGVVEQIPQRIAHVLYLDAFVPQNGQSAFDLAGGQTRAAFEKLATEKGDGWRVPIPFPLDALGLTAEVDLRWCTHRFTTTPIKAFAEPVAISNPAAAALPRTFIYCNKPAMGFFDGYAKAARENPRWKYHALATGHVPMVTAPRELTNLLLPLAPHHTAP